MQESAREKQLEADLSVKKLDTNTSPWWRFHTSCLRSVLQRR